MRLYLTHMHSPFFFMTVLPSFSRLSRAIQTRPLHFRTPRLRTPAPTTDWGSVNNVDLERVVEYRDGAALQRNFDNICFADINEADFPMFTEPANVVQLFRLMQLTMEYQLHVQTQLMDTIRSQKEWIDAHQHRNAKLRKELEELRRGKAQQAHRCGECNAAFSSPEFLERHVQRRHRGQQQADMGPLMKELAAIRAQIDSTSLKELQRMADLELNVEGVTGDAVAQIKLHVTLEADRIIRELSGRPAPAPAPVFVPSKPEPAAVHPLERQPKYVWFKNMPFLLARYPAPPPGVLMKTLKTLQQVALKHTPETLTTMLQESQKMGFPRAALAGTTETIIKNHYTPSGKLAAAVELAQTAAHEAKKHCLDVRADQIERARDAERARTRGVDAEFQSIHAQMVAAGRGAVPPPQPITPRPVLAHGAPAGAPGAAPQVSYAVPGYGGGAPGGMPPRAYSVGPSAFAAAAGPQSPQRPASGGSGGSGGNNHGFVSSPTRGFSVSANLAAAPPAAPAGPGPAAAPYAQLPPQSALPPRPQPAAVQAQPQPQQV